ncbi:hypothetical protein B0H16DRAFT_1473395 [Mycena metata]|uniref:Uncharacterized protein n=1 Tax=Mycena metata TaxID=1033252 RepID=A0AAD7HL41_9AGAR|nr:hypothetical protein B0H16DRAFT_1473395 [Mycena metata]
MLALSPVTCRLPVVPVAMPQIIGPRGFVSSAVNHQMGSKDLTKTINPFQGMASSLSLHTQPMLPECPHRYQSPESVLVNFQGRSKGAEFYIMIRCSGFFKIFQVNVLCGTTMFASAFPGDGFQEYNVILLAMVQSVGKWSSARQAGTIIYPIPRHVVFQSLKNAEGIAVLLVEGHQSVCRHYLNLTPCNYIGRPRLGIVREKGEIFWEMKSLYDCQE